MHFYYLLLLVTSFLWAGNFVAGKFLVGYASPLALTEMRWLIAVVLLFFFVLWKEKSVTVPKKALLPLILMGFSGVVLFNVFLFLALRSTSADNVGLLSTLNPIAIAVAAYFIFREKMSVQQIFAMFVSLIGVLFVLTHGHLENIFSMKFNIGDLYMLLAVSIWGLYSMAGRVAMKLVSPYKATLWSGIFGTIFILPFTFSEMTTIQTDGVFWIATLYAAVGATVLAMVFWNIGVHYIGGTKSGMFLNFNPIFTAILAYFLLGEKITGAQAIGALLIMTGVVLFTVKVRKKEFKSINSDTAYDKKKHNVS
ncbi:DMT family transporter [Metabacillus herbersteinensis]|uniref:DMT family transporter n=1 Tax=Metabacillus herbersteinensis TaxID=283816 RepID=A0ABV6GA18_9BACI